MRIPTLILLIVQVYGRSYDVYDFIIVGSGPAGSVLANRLSAHPEFRVLLLEAGQRSNLLSEPPSLYIFLQGTPYDWNDTVSFPRYNDFGVGDEPSRLPQGKALGGGSIINSMLYVRGNRKDYDNWEQKGAYGWSWKDVFPFFIKSENNRNPEIADNGFHGKNGELFVQYPAFATPLMKKYLKSVHELGFGIGDVNGIKQTVFTNPQINTKDGRRWGMDKAFLNPILGRRNLRVLTSAFVRKILFGEDKVAKGVEYEYQNRTYKAFVKKEVIISAGTIRSPQLLMLSGIGPARELRKLQIPVISDLPVGENFQDHPVLSTPIYKVRNLSLSEGDYKQYLSNGKGLLASLPTEVLGFFSSNYNPDPDWPDAEIIFVTLMSSSFLPPLVGGGTVLCTNVAVRPESRGKVSLSSRNPHSPPIIEGNYLTKQRDVRVMVEGLKTCLKIANTASLKGIGERIPLPNVPVCSKYKRESDGYYSCLIKQLSLPGYHLMGTCRMGDPKDNTTVVDSNLKVKGVKGLRVVDASVAPEIVVGHPQAMTLMIGEKAADMIYKDYLMKMKSWV
ncbi:glucose dehydrogenase [FAD, quinone]-like [Centruroides vittatus]|uniref:glucose dehydrogenase [FAD, quinone]-like n=1 Tax=Centruroides vittatus TaxID=120091 RepID=UPI00350F4846